MDWKVSLDRYLTSEPEDNFTPFVEKVYEFLPDSTFDEMEKHRFIDSEIESAFLWHCQEIAPEMVALHMITLFYKLKEKNLILRTKFWENGSYGFHDNSASIRNRAEHLGKFYAENLYLL